MGERENWTQQIEVRTILICLCAVCDCMPCARVTDILTMYTIFSSTQRRPHTFYIYGLRVHAPFLWPKSTTTIAAVAAATTKKPQSARRRRSRRIRLPIWFDNCTLFETKRNPPPHTFTHIHIQNTQHNNVVCVCVVYIKALAAIATTRQANGEKGACRNPPHWRWKWEISAKPWNVFQWN